MTCQDKTSYYFNSMTWPRLLFNSTKFNSVLSLHFIWHIKCNQQVKKMKIIPTPSPTLNGILVERTLPTWPLSSWPNNFPIPNYHHNGERHCKCKVMFSRIQYSTQSGPQWTRRLNPESNILTITSSCFPRRWQNFRHDCLVFNRPGWQFFVQVF